MTNLGCAPAMMLVLAASVPSRSAAANSSSPVAKVKAQCVAGKSLPTLKMLSEAVSAKPNDPVLQGCLGEANLAVGNKAAAIKAYGKSLAFDPTNLAVNTQYAALLRDAIEAEPANNGLRLVLIETLLHTGGEVDAEKETTAFLESSSADEQLKLTRILISNHKPDRAQPILMRLTKLTSAPVEAHAQLGLVLMQKQDFENAVWELGQAVQAEPKSSQYSLVLADALLRWHHYSTALSFLNAIKKEFGGLPEFQYDLAYANYGLRNFDSAISSATVLSQQHPKYAPAQFLLGNCYVAQGNMKRGAELLTRAIRLDPAKPAYYAALAQVQRYNGQLTAAVGSIEKGLSLDPEYSDLIFESALCHESEGNLKIAQTQLEKLVTNDPGMTKAHRALARVYGRLGNGAAAEGERLKLTQLESKQISTEHTTEDDR